MSASIDSELKLSFSEIASSMKVQIHVFAIGGKGLIELSKIPAGIKDLESVKSVLSDYMKTMTPENAAPLRYHIGTMDVFGRAIEF